MRALIATVFCMALMLDQVVHDVTRKYPEGVWRVFQGKDVVVRKETPMPTWVQDPSAGHYDCPKGWTEYSREEPYPPYIGSIAAIYQTPTVDAKGHILQDRPKPGICVADQ